jgi:hypothetical protein
VKRITDARCLKGLKKKSVIAILFDIITNAHEESADLKVSTPHERLWQSPLRRPYVICKRGDSASNREVERK